MTISPAAAKTIKRRLAMFLVTDSDGGKGLENELDIIVRFFNGVQICLENGLCDRKVANAFLGSYAQSIWANFGPYIESRRSIIDGYGAGLELFLKGEEAAGS